MLYTLFLDDFKWFYNDEKQGILWGREKNGFVSSLKKSYWESLQSKIISTLCICAFENKWISFLCTIHADLKAVYVLVYMFDFRHSSSEQSLSLVRLNVHCSCKYRQHIFMCFDDDGDDKNTATEHRLGERDSACTTFQFLNTMVHFICEKNDIYNSHSKMLTHFTLLRHFLFIISMHLFYV